MNQETQKDKIVLARPPEPQWFYLVISFLIFPVGLFLGKIYLDKDGLENKTFGTRTFSLGLALPLILIFIVAVTYLLI